MGHNQKTERNIVRNKDQCEVAYSYSFKLYANYKVKKMYKTRSWLCDLVKFTQPRIHPFDLSTKIPYQNSSLCLPGILLASQVELAVEGVVPGNLDWVALGVEVLELDLAALEPLAEVTGHLNERGGESSPYTFQY